MRWPVFVLGLLALALGAGCSLSHGLSPGLVDEGPSSPSDAGSPDTAGPCREAEFAPPVPLFLPDAPRPVMQGGDHAVAALDDGFIVVWVENRGADGLGVASVIVDSRGAVRRARFDASPGLRRVDNVAVTARGDTIEVYAIEDSALFRTTIVDGVVGEPVALGELVDRTVPLMATARESFTDLIVSAGGPTLLRVAPDGSIDDRILLTDADPPWVWSADRQCEQHVVAWASSLFSTGC